MASSVGITLKTKQDYVNEYKGLQQMFAVVGGALAVIVPMLSFRWISRGDVSTDTDR